MLSEPDSRHAGNLAARTHYCLGFVARLTGDRQLAQHHFQEAIKIGEALDREAQARKLVPGNELRALMLALVYSGQHARAAEVAERVWPTADPTTLAQEVGRVYGLCVSAVGAGKNLDQLTDEERRLRAHYRERCFAAVKESVSRGYDNSRFFESVEYQSLREVPESRQWLAELNKK
jgi:hypothetical protein